MRLTQFIKTTGQRYVFAGRALRVTEATAAAVFTLGSALFL
jgi:hypothetical protein